MFKIKGFGIVDCKVEWNEAGGELGMSPILNLYIWSAEAAGIVIKSMISGLD
jgi:hypothetical protein